MFCTAQLLPVLFKALLSKSKLKSSASITLSSVEKVSTELVFRGRSEKILILELYSYSLRPCGPSAPFLITCDVAQFKGSTVSKKSFIFIYLTYSMMELLINLWFLH